MNLPRLLGLAAVFSGLLPVSAFAKASGDFICVNAHPFSKGQVVEVKVSVKPEWPSLAVITYLNPRSDQTEVVSFPPKGTEVRSGSNYASAEGFEPKSSRALAEIEIRLDQSKKTALKSRMLSEIGYRLPAVVKTYPGILTVRRGFLKQGQVEMDCAVLLKQ